MEFLVEYSITKIFESYSPTSYRIYQKYIVQTPALISPPTVLTHHCPQISIFLPVQLQPTPDAL